MRKLGFGLVLAGVLLIAGSVFLHFKMGSLTVETPTAVLELERKLARPGLLAVATLNVEAMVDLAASEAEDPAWNEPFVRAGIDLENDVSHATLALTAHDSGDPRAAFALFGRFDPAAIERALLDNPEFTVAPGKAAGENVLHLKRIDPESCEESGPWAMHLGDEQILIAHADEIATLLRPADPADGALRDLTRFQSFRSGQLLTGAIFIPDELPKTENFIVAMAAQAAAQQVNGFRAFYAGASPQLVPPGLEIAALFEGIDPATASAKAAAWQAAIEQFRGSLAEGMPTLATLLDGLELSAEGNDLHAELRLSRDEIEKLQELPGEVGSSLFGGGMQVTLGDDEASEEQIDENPLSFLAETSGAKLPAYDPSVAFAGAAEQSVGPFGVRLLATRLLEADGRSEFEIEAFATGVPNLGDLSKRVSIEITSIEGKGGQELMAAEHCGADRNDKPAPLAASFGGEVLTGSKKVRAREGAGPAHVGRIVGSATIRLPVRTETVRIPAAAGESVTRGDARLEITRAAGSSFSYSSSSDALLHLRALNAAGKPLASVGSTTSTIGSGRSGSLQFGGVVHEIEAIFALEEEELRFPFALDEMRPGTEGEFLAQNTGAAAKASSPIAGALEDWLEKLAGNVAQAVERTVDGSDRPLATQRTGPFIVTLESIWAFGGLMPRLGVAAPEIPGVEGNPTAVELSLEEIRMTDGSIRGGPWSEVLRMSQGFGKPGLSGAAQLQTGAAGSADDVMSLHGSVSIRLPKQVATKRFESAELGARVEAPGLAVRLVELGRDRFTVRASQGGDRLLSARALNAFGDELWVPHSSVERGEDGAIVMEFEVKGVPEQIELRFAEKLAHASYPFVLTKVKDKIARK